MLSLSETAKIGGGVEARKTRFHVSYPSTDFEQPADVHIADNLIWVVRCCLSCFIKIVLSVL